MPLVEQRNRFLSFAFAASDILIETDKSGIITFAAGATAALPDAPASGEDAFEARLDQTSRPVFRAFLRRLRPSRRIGPAGISIQGRRAQLSGWVLEDSDRVRWTVAFDALDAPDEVDPQAFERSATEAIREAREQGKPLSMSLLSLSCEEDCDRLLGPDDAHRLHQAIAASCLIAVGDSGVAHPVDSHRTALIHPQDMDGAALKREVRETLDAFDLEEVEVHLSSVCDAPELDAQTTVQAFLHAINTAAETGKALDLASLQAAAAQLMAETEQRITELRTTIAGRVVEPHAQPVIDLQTGEVHHHELLLRLPGGRPVEESVGFAESTGLIYEIDFAMTEIAANFLREDYDRPSLAVNLSGKSLTNMNWAKKFMALLADLKIDRSRLMFELTETASIKNIKAANSVIAKIRERGHPVCLDDFGAGVAGINYLRDFPLDVVKIDGSYVRRFDKSERDQRLLGGMIGLVNAMGADAIAESIETEACAQRMKALGVRFGQGYYFGKPVALKELKGPRINPNRAA
ncbi:EAL domain-containing protein [Maricaulis parjimensis]|uniref:EAL domain-containing protein n=1 Tax=Maricaulis parjimensis TaxID=144023 RepID=UPI0019398858|nr:EAL domain-containing protein [Maricaulis parjimensis]